MRSRGYPTFCGALEDHPSSECRYSGDYVTADLCKAFACVLIGNHHVLCFAAPRARLRTTLRRDTLGAYHERGTYAHTIKTSDSSRTASVYRFAVNVYGFYMA